MTLRSRLFVTGLLVAVPLALVWFVIDTRLRITAKVEELQQSVALDLASGLRDRCEAAPPATGRPGRGGGLARGVPPQQIAPWDTLGRGTSRPNTGGRRGPAGGLNPGGNGVYQYFAYDSDGRPTADDAPQLPARRDGRDPSVYWSTAGAGVELVVPLQGNSRCAYLLTRIPPRPRDLPDQAQALFLVVVSVLVAAWVAAGPVIGKLRRLADGVRRSAASHYEIPVAVDAGDELASLAGAFNDAGREVRTHILELQSREESLRAFVANTAHDVGIPLSVLQGHLTALETELRAPEEQELVRGAVQEAHYIGSLLRNLGAATRLEDRDATISRRPVDLVTVVDHVVTRHRPIARASGIELNAAVPDEAVALRTDPTLVEQALGNLVDNAVRYNHGGGHVAVVLDCTGDTFTLSVTDDGPGVSEADLSLLTTRWFRGSDARTRRPDGKGLGLAIASESLARLDLDLSFSRPADGGLRAEIRGHLQP